MNILPKINSLNLTLQQSREKKVSTMTESQIIENNQQQLPSSSKDVAKFYSPKVNRTFYKVDLQSLDKFRTSSQSTNDSLDDKKMANSDMQRSRKSILQSPLSLSNIFNKRDSKQLSQSQILLNNCSSVKRNFVLKNPLESIEEQKKLNFKEYMNNQIKKKTEVRGDKIRQKLMKMNTPYEEQLAFPNKAHSNQSNQRTPTGLPSLNLQNNKKEQQQQQQQPQRKFIEIDEDLHKFNANFKNINKIIDSNSHFAIENSLEIAMLSATQNSNIMPKKLGILNSLSYRKISQSSLGSHTSSSTYKEELDLSNQNITEGYSKMIQQVLQHPEMSQLKVLKLKNCNLTTNSLQQITTTLPQSIQEIDLEQNHLGSHDFNFAITPLLSQKNYPFLKALNIENNRIGDLGFHSILKTLLNSSLSILNLSNNNLTDACSEGISQLLKESQEINELYLHWNKFSSQGGIAIANGIEMNTSLQVLDLSYNGLGNPKGVKCALRIIKSCTTKFTQVKHLDLSFNMISKEETQEISNFLSKNTTLFGIHYLGNQGDWILDSRGFLVQIDCADNARDEQVHYSKQRIQGLKCVKQKQKLSNDIINQDICWICNGWQEIKFKVTVEKSSTFAKHPVFLHLDFENYRPHYMDPDPNNPDRFILKRMCPPNRRIQFFFSDPTQKVLYYTHDYPTMSFMRNQLLGIQFYNKEQSQTRSCYASPNLSAKNRKAANFFQKKFFKLQYLDSTIIEYQEPFLVNWVETSFNPNLFTKDYEPIVESRPRWPETFFKINFTNEWTFEKSIFSTYIRDSDDLLDKCFEFDWENSRLDKVLNTYCTTEESKNKCKEILKKEYNLIRCVYKHHASLGIIGDIPSISQNQFSNISMKMKLTDGKLFKISDLDYNFITVNSSKNKDKNYRNPDKAMIRFEFIEVFARIAIDKYIRTGVCKNALDSLEIFFSSKSVREKLEEIEDPQTWRDTKYWIEECDIVLNNYIEMIQEIWNKFANSRKAEKRGFQTTKTMSIYEFTDMVKTFNLMDDFLGERDIPLAFNLAMMTQVDEINNDRFIQMTFVEFLEALARLADKKSMEPLGTVPGSYNLSERYQIRLEFKLESMLESMKQKIIQQSKDKQKTINIVFKDKQMQEEEAVHTPLVPSIQLSNIQQKQIGQINSARRFQDINNQLSSLQFSQDSITNDY